MLTKMKREMNRLVKRLIARVERNSMPAIRAAMIIAVPLKVETPVVRCACWTTISVVVEARVRPKMGGIKTR